MTSARATRRALFEIADSQDGFFTAAQARSVGYDYAQQSYHVQVGNWIKEARGVYHLADYTWVPYSDIITLALQTMNRAGAMQGVISYETALDLHGISDANPRRIHITLPPGYRKRLPGIAYPHTGIVPPADYEEWHGFRITTPLRTILDVAASPVSWVFTDGAVRDALREGKVRMRQLLDRAENDEVQQRLIDAIEATEESVRV